MKTYTEDEINKALFQLNNRMEDLKLQRQEINKSINDVKKNIDYYNNLDKRQIKLW